MATIISKNDIDLFISYGPGTGSTSLEQFIRTFPHNFESEGCKLTHYPKEEYGIGSNVSRHIPYTKFKEIFNRSCSAIATGIRDPISFYYAEYKRILLKWSPLLSDKNSWIYNPSSKSTLDLIILAKEVDSFDTWFNTILQKKKIMDIL